MKTCEVAILILSSIIASLITLSCITYNHVDTLTRENERLRQELSKQFIETKAGYQKIYCDKKKCIIQVDGENIRINQ